MQVGDRVRVKPEYQYTDEIGEIVEISGIDIAVSFPVRGLDWFYENWLELVPP